MCTCMVSTDADVVEKALSEVREIHDESDDYKWSETDTPRTYILNDVQDALVYHSDDEWSEFIDEGADEDVVTRVTDRIMDDE